MLTVILVNMSIEYFIRAYIFVLFLSALCRPIVGAVLRQSLLLLHLFQIFVVRQVCVPVMGFFVCGGAGSAQNELLLEISGV